MRAHSVSRHLLAVFGSICGMLVAFLVTAALCYGFLYSWLVKGSDTDSLGWGIVFIGPFLLAADLGFSLIVGRRLTGKMVRFSPAVHCV